MAKILIVGGTGLTGAHAALYLRDQGHEVTIMSRKAPAMACLQALPHIAANYVDNDVAAETLAHFDSMVFAAGADLRQFPPGEDEASFYERVNIQGIPNFFRSCHEFDSTLRTRYDHRFHNATTVSGENRGAFNCPEELTNLYLRSRSIAAGN